MPKLSMTMEEGEFGSWLVAAGDTVTKGMPLAVVMMPGVPLLTRPSILVARDLAPADTATLDPDLVLGFVTELGGPTSHTAILAKQLGIPAVVGCPDAAAFDDGVQVVVDGSAGEVTVDPSEDMLAGIAARAATRAAMPEPTR